MLRFVLDDYKKQFKSGLKNIAATEFFLYIYLLIYPPILGEMFAGYHSLPYYGTVIPLCVGVFLSRMYPNQLSKTLLLCPITDSEKKEYLLTAFLSRISIPMFLYLLISGISLKLHLLSQYHLCIGLVLLLLIVSFNIYCSPKQKISKAAEQTYSLPEHYEFWSIASQLVGLGSLLVIFALTDKPATAFGVAIIIILMLLDFVIFIKFCFTYYKPVMERAIKYEDNY